MIKIENLQKIYSGKISTRALGGVSFDVKEGEFVAIMGRSGSGKSTLLHQLGLIDNPTAGKILIDNVNILNLSDSEKTLFRLKNLGYVFQEYALISELTALENVYLPAFVLGGDHNGYKKRASELLEIVGLGDRLDHYPNENNRWLFAAMGIAVQTAQWKAYKNKQSTWNIKSEVLGV